MACDTPLLIVRKGELLKGKLYNHDVQVPCGKCPPCKRRRISDWVFRLMEEDKYSSSSYFITITYTNDFVPMTTNKRWMTLNKKDWQDYMKRLRKAQSKTHPHLKIKYYMVGEYGGITSRPHFHAIIFNVSNPDIITSSWHKEGVSMGDVDIGTVSGASIAYTAKYIDKESSIPYGPSDLRIGQFSTMSHGLGDSFLTDGVIKYYHADLKRYYVTTQNGCRIALPRYYRNKIYSDDQKQIQTAYIQQLVHDKNILDELQYNENYPDDIHSYQEFLDTCRTGRYKAFYNKQTKRDVRQNITSQKDKRGASTTKRLS